MISALETNVNIASWLSELQKNHLHYAYTAVHWMITFIFFPWKNHVFCDIRLKLSSVNFWDTLSLFRLHLIWRDPKSNYCIYGIGCWPVYIAIPFYKKNHFMSVFLTFAVSSQIFSALHTRQNCRCQKYPPSGQKMCDQAPHYWKWQIKLLRWPPRCEYPDYIRPGSSRWEYFYIIFITTSLKDGSTMHERDMIAH